MACTVSSDKIGVLRGLEATASDSGSRIRYYGGIPYALPPLGQRRFRRPRPLPKDHRYEGHFDAKSPVCPQPEWLGTRQEDLWDEDCLRLNIYVPGGPPPANGWPVFFYIHGGFLQFGGPNMSPEALAPLLMDTAFRCIIVQPGYRLNAFGFLASHELQAEAEADGQAAGNMGFWDQRLALEWTHANIRDFGGNPNNMTVAGYSAGAHSTFQQLAHELYAVAPEKAIIKRVIMWSNSPGIQPKHVREQQEQFDELLSLLGISASLSAVQKLAKLRDLPAHAIIDAQDRMKMSEFRATTENSFVLEDSVSHINSGDFAKRLKSRGIKIMNGECRDEHNLYRAWRTSQDSYEGLYVRLCADYPESIVKRVLRHYCGKSKQYPSGYASWQDLFGHIYADLQVHLLERGFYDKIASELQPGKDLFRYRFEWRAGCAIYPPEWGVTHATDMAIWFWYPGLTIAEKEILRPWNEVFAQFVKGDDVDWGTKTIRDARRLRSDGRTDVLDHDERWDEGLHVWKLLNEDQTKAQL